MNINFSGSEIEILNILSKNGGSMLTIDLVRQFQLSIKNTPKQTVYRALSALRKKEVVSVVKRKTSVNTHWVGYIRSLMDNLESKNKVEELPNKLVINFPSLWSLAPTWTHYTNVLISQSDKKLPVIFINPHQWFYIAREWSEEQLVNSIKNNGYFLWQVITHDEKLDKEIIKQKFANDPSVQGCIIPDLPIQKELYVNVIGDYVISVYMSESFTFKINQWYAKTKILSEESVDNLRDIIKNSGKVKIVIQKNAKKAESHRSKLAKYFYYKK